MQTTSSLKTTKNKFYKGIKALRKQKRIIRPYLRESVKSLEGNLKLILPQQQHLIV